jgi:hypothetical protein
LSIEQNITETWIYVQKIQDTELEIGAIEISPKSHPQYGYMSAPARDKYSHWGVLA